MLKCEQLIDFDKLKSFFDAVPQLLTGLMLYTATELELLGVNYYLNKVKLKERIRDS